MKLKIWIFFIGFILYEEILFMFLSFGKISNNFITLIIFALAYALIFSFLCSFFNKKGNTISTYILTIIISLTYIIQFIYYKMFNSLLSFYSYGNIGTIISFIIKLLKTIGFNIIGIILFLLPLIVLIYTTKKKKFAFSKKTTLSKLYILTTFFIVQIIGLFSVWRTSLYDDYSLRNLYYNINYPTKNAEELGLMTMMRLDIERYFTNFNEISLDYIKKD